MIRVLINKVPIGTITAPYGSIDSVHVTPHTGIDIAFELNHPLYAPLSGTVSRIADYGNTGLGKAIFVRLDDGRQYILGHLNSIPSNIHVGDRVVSGKTLLGFVGSTGNSTGSHLHFGALDQHGHFIDPYTLFEHAQSALFKQSTEAVISIKSVVTETFQWLSDNIHDTIV
jgi:murein DD-endopeptidase MepM/ murein hydrolase activator NlpD